MLSKKSEPLSVGFADRLPEIVQDLLDTAFHHKENCAGLAANQIGILATIFVIRRNDTYIPIINPVVLARTGGIVSRFESCLSLPGTRTKKRRHKRIILRYFNTTEKKEIQTFRGWEARIAQHELDHLNGILI